MVRHCNKPSIHYRQVKIRAQQNPHGLKEGVHERPSSIAANHEFGEPIYPMIDINEIDNSATNGSIGISNICEKLKFNCKLS